MRNRFGLWRIFLEVWSGFVVIAMVGGAYCAAFGFRVETFEAALAGAAAMAAGIYGRRALAAWREMRERIGEGPGLPHLGVYARIAVSEAGPSRRFAVGGRPGVGVRAVRDIPKGALVFSSEEDAAVRVRKADVEGLEDAWRRLYEDFCPVEGAYYICPTSFNKLTVAWYMNDSDEPNVEIDGELRFRASRDILAGEELVTRYRDFSE